MWFFSQFPSVLSSLNKKLFLPSDSKIHVCMSTHMCVFRGIHVHIYAPCMSCVQVRGKPQAVFSVTIHHYFFFETSSLADLELTKWAMMAGQWPPGIPLSPSPHGGITKVCHHFRIFKWLLGTELKHPTEWTISWDLVPSFTSWIWSRG